MSILVCEVLPIGIVFAADKNVTIIQRDGQGNVLSEGQDLGSKILRWPRNKGLLGYVGHAAVGGQTMHEWLYDFIGDHITFADPEVVAKDLRDRLQHEIGGPGAEASIIQFATFAKRQGVVVPEHWHVTNIHGMTDGEYDPPSETFMASERLLAFTSKDLHPHKPCVTTSPIAPTTSSRSGSIRVSDSRFLTRSPKQCDKPSPRFSKLVISPRHRR